MTDTAVEMINTEDANPGVEAAPEDGVADDDVAVEENVGGEDEASPDEENSTAAPADPNEALLQALNHKDEGNNHFKSGDLISAARSYRHGTTLLKNLNQNARECKNWNGVCRCLGSCCQGSISTHSWK